MQLTVEDIPKILDMADVVRAEIVCADLDVSEFTNEEVGQRIVTLWESNSAKLRKADPITKKFTLILTTNEINCLVKLFNSFNISGEEPERIQKKLRQIVMSERQA